MKKPSFSKLKANYKTLPTQIHSCSMSFPNTCAIRMSEALVKTDSSFLDTFQNSSKNKCPHGYLRGAQDLAAVLCAEESPDDLDKNHQVKVDAHLVM
ncbi:type VI secretion system amidase effector protein Tae4 [Vibrio vulnificus]|nr:type VI secretion system amidase effector protein Tae4 [Vibrio vulnificus]